MKRIPLRSKDLSKLVENYKFEVSKKDFVEIIDDKIIIINKISSFFYYEDKVVPTLKLLKSHSLLKSVIIDIGAVKFIVNGADLMRPGIKEINQEIKKGDFVSIQDENNKISIAVGIALFDAEEMSKMTSGKAIKIIHYIGDELWEVN